MPAFPAPKEFSQKNSWITQWPSGANLMISWLPKQGLTRSHTASFHRTHAVLLMPTFPCAAEPHFQPMLSPFDFGFTGAFNAAGCPVTQVPMGLGSEQLPIGIQVESAHGCDHVILAVASMLACSKTAGAG
jgi:Asp-tRNA(Asn)/Glu-tRNA(Gln) amidotransferase A subunit family amidase